MGGHAKGPARPRSRLSRAMTPAVGAWMSAGGDAPAARVDARARERTAADGGGGDADRSSARGCEAIDVGDSDDSASDVRASTWNRDRTASASDRHGYQLEKQVSALTLSLTLSSSSSSRDEHERVIAECEARIAELGPRAQTMYAKKAAAELALGLIEPARRSAEACIQLAPLWFRGFMLSAEVALHGEDVKARIDVIRKDLERAIFLDPRIREDARFQELSASLTRL